MTRFLCVLCMKLDICVRTKITQNEIKLCERNSGYFMFSFEFDL